MAPKNENLAELTQPEKIDQEVGLKVIEGIRKKYQHNLTGLLKIENHEPVFRTLTPYGFDDWDQPSKDAYLQSLSRLSGALIDLSWATTKSFTDNLIAEGIKLGNTTSLNARDSALVLIQLGAIYVALENDTNTSGGGYRDFQEKMENLLNHFGELNDEASLETLANPLGLKDGDEIINFDTTTRQLTSEKIVSVELIGDNGLVTTGDKAYELEELNHDLLTGKRMLNNGENILGGVSRYEKALYSIRELKPGDKIVVDVRGPLDKEARLTEYVFCATNLEEIEEKWGKAFLPFIYRFPPDKPLVTIDVESEGKVYSGVDIRDLKNIEVK